jgi:hypothetical protein
MPKPVYILFSESGSEDKATGLVSHFKVLEQIECRELPKPQEDHPGLISLLSCQIVAVWAKADEDDPEEQYEFQVLLYLRSQLEAILAASGTLAFEATKPRNRTTVNVIGISFRDAGVFRVEHRIRPHGGEDRSWLVQTYEVPVTHVGLQGAEQPAPTPSPDSSTV